MNKNDYYAIPVQWVKTAVIYIKAKTPVDAMRKFYKYRDLVIIPEEQGAYKGLSFDITVSDPVFIKECTLFMKQNNWPHFDKLSYDFDDKKEIMHSGYYSRNK